MALAVFNILIFPGLLFLGIYGFILEFADRKLYAHLQNRMGPPWFQPLADFIKLSAKKTIIPDEADKRMFRLLPSFALAASAAAFLYIPLWGVRSLYPFTGDLIVVIYFLTIPTLTFALAGWHSSSLYSALGSVRTLTQLFAFEVPLIAALMGPALLSDSWSVSGMASFYSSHPAYSLFNIPGFIAALVAAQGKLEKVPFDIPEAETEIVAGAFTEYSGRLLAVFRLSVDIELVVVASLLSAVFIPVYLNAYPVLGFLMFILKTLFIVLVLAIIRSLTARLRLEQMVDFCWRYLAPLALFQILADILVKGLIPS